MLISTADLENITRTGVNSGFVGHSLILIQVFFLVQILGVVCCRGPLNETLW